MKKYVNGIRECDSEITYDINSLEGLRLLANCTHISIGQASKIEKLIMPDGEMYYIERSVINAAETK